MGKFASSQPQGRVVCFLFLSFEIVHDKFVFLMGVGGNAEITGKILNWYWYIFI